jgi:hypothetical protein
LGYTSSKEKGDEIDIVRQTVCKDRHIIVATFAPRWTTSLQWAGGGTIVQRACMINLAKVLKSWTSHMKRIILPLEKSKSSCTITAARIKNKGKFIIGAKEETR